MTHTYCYTVAFNSSQLSDDECYICGFLVHIVAGKHAKFDSTNWPKTLRHLELGIRTFGFTVLPISAEPLGGAGAILIGRLRSGSWEDDARRVRVRDDCLLFVEVEPLESQGVTDCGWLRVFEIVREYVVEFDDSGTAVFEFLLLVRRSRSAMASWMARSNWELSFRLLFVNREKIFNYLYLEKLTHILVIVK